MRKTVFVNQVPNEICTILRETLYFVTSMHKYGLLKKNIFHVDHASLSKKREWNFNRNATKKKYWKDLTGEVEICYSKLKCKLEGKKYGFR